MIYITSIITWVLAAGIGSWFVNQGLTGWYLQIAKPAWTPSGGVIGAVWTFLYAIIIIAMIITWKKLKNNDLKVALSLFFVNALLNCAWNFFFFANHSLGLALVEIFALLLETIWLIYVLWPKVREAAFLLIPYACWVAFASYLTYSVWVLNR